jgi:hypothetical protein
MRIGSSLLLLLLCACHEEQALVTLEAKGFDPVGRAHIAVFDLTRGGELGREVRAIAGGGFEAPIAGIERGSAYRIDVFIDRDRDEVCDVRRDFTFSLDVGADLEAEGVTFALTPVAAEAPIACESFGAGRLTVSYEGFPRGQRVEVRVFSNDGGPFHAASQPITASFGSIELFGAVLPNRQIEVAVWIDRSPLEVCDPEDRIVRSALGAFGQPGAGVTISVAGDDATAGCDALFD